MKEFKFVLLENAMDSLQQGVGFALMEPPTRSNLKLSILLIAQAIELLLKERLRREHWSLIFKDIEKAGKSNATTVTISEALSRLEHIAKVKFETKERDTIFNFSAIRNQIQHYEIEVTFEEVAGKAQTAIGFIVRFLKDEFKSDIRDYLEKADIQKLLLIDEALAHLQELARLNIEKIRKENQPIRAKDQMGWQFEVIDCPQCWQEFYVFSPSSDISQCQLCNYEGGFIECTRCGYQAPVGALGFDNCDSGVVLCDNCWEEIGDESFEIPE